ncbi:hypothetical protein GUITHDRAFT_138176 [Guillardia theta CCMP2712]|uniref:Amino acid transporter transmembrane domain-containing protein n=1 Tax=Guillardia theta (strain CCMP2712) TaxID=905079 RepID=L1JE89_GUITC|nr:hypothetical protein GUITHDRAFT_138176 [Guillardia theta CCMP2712]EKX46425.1 hypothetical protein GUITHDRAFT_138176 [Guillardia theta CCMP2712]|eukprot:XP_005833405.1 hypothetical protein GUITHDRAFT_138176 [Guillardia theta CCMP2712]
MIRGACVVLFLFLFLSVSVACDKTSDIKISTLETSAHILKAVMGAGSAARKEVLLAKARRSASSRAGYAKLENGVLGSHQHLRRVLGPAGEKLVSACLLCASIGVCSENVCSMLQGGCQPWSKRVLVTSSIVVGLTFLSWLRDLRKLSFTSLLGDIAIVGGLIITIISALLVDGGMLSGGGTSWLQDHLREAPLLSFSTLPLSFGIIAFLFCTQFLSLPIEASMLHPEQYEQAVFRTFIGTAIANIIFGLIGALTWGASVNQIVILNLNSSLVVVLVKACLCVDLFFTFPIVIFPALEMIERSLDLPSDVESVWPRNLFRSCIVCCTAFIALLVPYFALLTDIFAGLGQTLLAFVVPPLLVIRLSESSLFSPRHNSFMWSIIVFGVSACVISTITSIHHILKH